ncbi:MAG: pseudouridine synthase [Candidatus Aminicenantes bacterium]|nr:pseudouridine synthase [Candidatus Aminicenantes bacterium]
MKKNITFKVREHCARIDHFLTAVLDTMSRNQIEKLIKNRQVSLNGTVLLRKNREVFPDDRITVEIETPKETVYIPSRSLTKLFEDEWLLVIDKPAGLVVHPGAGEKQETVLDIFRYLCPQITAMSDQERPGIVHRLDKDTSGILILAKTEEALEKMQ